ncbi:MAG: hypothetical protein ABJN35_04835 [Erythrobacter sp.]
MMKRGVLTTGTASVALAVACVGAVAASWVSAQEAPESLLPPGFDDPLPAPTPAPPPTAAPPVAPVGPAQPVTGPATGPVTGPAPAPGAPLSGNIPPAPQLSEDELSGLPSLEELEDLSTDQLDDLLGLKPKFDIPPAARRSLAQVGVISPQEGGLPIAGLANQPENLVRAVLAGMRGPIVSRWGHILTRRTMASRLAAPEGMDPVEFATLRAGVLNSIGEYAVTRGLVQDVDTGNWSEAMTSQALTAYIASSDLVGACPAVRLQGSSRENPEWVMMQAICNAYAGEGALAGSQLNGAQNDEIAPEIDILLAQRYAGAAGRGRGGTTVSWDGVEELTPWRFAIANAVGDTIPAALLESALSGPRGAYYPLSAASAPMLPLSTRAQYAEVAARRGVLSASAMVDLYSQVYSDNSISGAATQRAVRLREAFVGSDPNTRIAAMKGLWGEGDAGFSGQILTAYAAARIAPSAENADDAGDLIASMLTAGLDRDAAAWRDVVEPGSMAWALIALSDPNGGNATIEGVDAFYSGDDSEEAMKSAFLVAGLAGLDRLSTADANNYGADLGRITRWTRVIGRAAEVRNPTMVAMLAGLGMQGEQWSQMTPLHLYHVVSALRQVGMEAEARLIAAEAVARI